MYKFFLLSIYFFFLITSCILSANNKYTFDNKVLLGTDVLISERLDLIKNKKIAILTNFSGRDSKGNLTVETLLSQSNVKISLILTPEHGFFGIKSAGEKVDDDTFMNIPVISLYGNNKKIPYRLAKEFDIILVDLQDIGVRAYTFISTLYYVMQSAVELNKPVVVLDRPNPLGGVMVDGCTLDMALKSYIGIAPLTYIHGLTIGEIANMMNQEGWINEKKEKNYRCDLTIIEMKGWKRWMQWEDTGLMWFPTSPHIPSVDAIRGAAMLGWIGELSVFSVGIGTNLPFQFFGFPGFSDDFFRTFTNLEFNGVTLFHSKFSPAYGKFAGQSCDGFLLKFERSNNFTPFSNGIELLLKIREYYPKMFDKTMVDANKSLMFQKATGSTELFELFFNKGSGQKIRQASNKGLKEFLKLREKYLLY